jgi:photosystem II stability/assembly factor-like uncharacterized protein
VKSIDGGISWNPLNISTSNMLYTFIIDPSNTQRQYLVTYNGIFKTTNDGHDWVVLNQGINTTGVYSLSIAPSSTQVLYAVTDSGVFKSTSGGV